MKKRYREPGRTEITIGNLTKGQIPTVRSIRRITKETLRLEDALPQRLTVTYVTDAQIKKFNLKYRNKDLSTDVLAFSMREGRHLKGEEEFLGDIIISVDAARRQARDFKTTKKKELVLYLIHGLLHLLGYDDETPKEAEKMKRRQEEIFEALR